MQLNPSAVFESEQLRLCQLSFVWCTDENACNYDDAATYDDGTCAYPAFPYGCDGACLNDTDGDGTCDEFETLGCTDEDACNYSSGATQDDNSCTYDCGGCTNPGACNFDEDALQDDGTCEFESCLTLGCTDSSACNYDADVAYNDGTCDFVSCLGCTDSDACNYDPSSTQDDGSCVLAELGYDCDGNCLSDADGDGVCDPSKWKAAPTPLPATTTALRRTTTVPAISALVQKRGRDVQRKRSRVRHRGRNCA